MRILVFFFILLHSIVVEAQLTTREVAVSSFKAESRCAWDAYTAYVKKQSPQPDSTTIATTADFLQVKQYFIIGSWVDTKVRTQNNELRNTRLYYFITLQHNSNNATNCNIAHYKVTTPYYVDRTRNTTIQNIWIATAAYDKYDLLSSDVAFVQQKGKWGMIDNFGNVKVPLVYDSLAMHALGIRALQHGEWNILDWRTGKQKNTKQYSRISSSFPKVKDTRLAAVEYEGKQGFINEAYEEVVPAIYDEVRVLAFRYAIGRRNGKTVLLDEHTGKELTPLKYDDIRYHDEDVLSVGIRSTNTYGFINGSGKEVLPPVYNEIVTYLAKDVIGVKKNGMYAIMNKFTYQPITGFKYDKLKRMWGDTIMVKQDGKWGAVNSKDEVVIPIRFDEGNDKLNGDVYFKLKDQTVLFRNKQCVEGCSLLE